MKIVEFFDKVLIINLPERLDRKNETIKEFKRQKWPIENTAFFRAIRPDDSAGFENPGVKGCFLSHLSAIREAKKEHKKNVLIMEDDVAFIKDINNKCDDVLEEISRTKWDFIYFGHEYPISANSSNKIIKITEPMRLAHCYAVNGCVFDRFILFLEELLKRQPGDPLGGPMHYDAAISTFRIQNPDINTYIVNPSLGYQRSSRTDLHALSYWDKSPLLSPFIAFIRKAKNTAKKISQ
ncbi:MAG: glycosyltransferase family 25 protein [Chlorobiaceae bacterium]